MVKYEQNLQRPPPRALGGCGPDFAREITMIFLLGTSLALGIAMLGLGILLERSR
jgi:hypothetical protein